MCSEELSIYQASLRYGFDRWVKDELEALLLGKHMYYSGNHAYYRIEDVEAALREVLRSSLRRFQ